MQKGFLFQPRKFFEGKLWQEPRTYSKAEAWLDIIQMASFQQSSRLIGMRLVDLPRGSVGVSIRFLASRWRWSHTKVLKFLSLMESEQAIERKTEQGLTVIYLLNYEEYQNPESYKANTDGNAQANERKTNASGNAKTNEEMPLKSEEDEKSEHQKERGKSENANKVERTNNKISTESPNGDSESAQAKKAAAKKNLERLNEAIVYAFGEKKVWTQKAKDKIKTRLKTFSIDDICAAFRNLVNEPDKWKLENNGQRPLAWWLHSDERILEMQNCHKKRGGSSRAISAHQSGAMSM